MKKYKERLLTSIIFTPAIIGILFLASEITFNLITFIVCFSAIFEWNRIHNFNKLEKILMTTLFLIMSFLIFFMKVNVLNKYISYASLIWWHIAFLLNFNFPSSMKIFNYFKSLKLISGILIIIPMLNGLICIRNYGCINNFPNGKWVICYIFIIVWLLDSTSYIIGSKFGKHKIFPLISPNKTLEGLLGGTLTTIVITTLIMKYIHEIPVFFSTFTIIIAIMCAVLGDLTESTFKRYLKIKDSGKIILGHGGILDRLDSLTAVIPIFHFLLITYY